MSVDLDRELFPQSAGFIGRTEYSLKYLENTQDSSCKWPRSNIFHLCSAEELFTDILNQNVGIDRSFAYVDDCDPLKIILGKFLNYHGRTNYKNLLQKCKITGKNRQQQSTTRRIIKEYVHRIIFNVIPLQLFGTKSNAIQFERNFRKIIHFGKHQVYSLDMVIRGIQVKKLPFLRHLGDYSNKTNLFAKLYVWLLQTYIFTALKCVFNVTVSAQSYEYVFYEKSVWKKIQKRRMKKIEKIALGTYKNCLIKGIVQTKHLFIVKLLPKRRGFRPIFMKLSLERDWKLKCQLCRKILEVLLSRVAGDYLKNVHLSWRSFHDKWTSLHEKWKSNLQPTVYFVRTDFTNAFGSVDLTKMMEIVSKLREENENAPNLNFTFQGWLKNVPLKAAFKMVEEYSTKFFFKHHEKVYRMTKGLCQGGPLSCQLFNLYLGGWEKLYLKEYLEDENGFFIRNCDDCLYLTMDFAKASSYLKLMEEGFSDFNLFVNGDKTETNVREESQVTLTFFNYTLDVQFFQIYQSNKFYRSCNIFQSSRLSTVEHPGKIVLQRIGRTCSLKLRQIFLDTAYNTTDTILYNVFTAASNSIASSLALMERLFLHLNEKFIMKCFVACSCRISKVAHDSLQSNDVDINQKMFQWIVIKAFIIQMNMMNSKKFVDVQFQVERYSQHLLEKIEVNQQEIIVNCFHTHCSGPY